MRIVDGLMANKCMPIGLHHLPWIFLELIS
jgi:hypothetical protein